MPVGSVIKSYTCWLV